MMRADTPVDAPTDTPQARKRNILGQVREALRSSARGHSPLFLWMRAHHDELVVEFAANPPNWQQLTQIFRHEALTDRTGKAPSPAIARLTWYRVRQAVAASRAKIQTERNSAARALPHQAPFATKATGQAARVTCSPQRLDRPFDIPAPVKPDPGDNDDAMTRLRRTLNERSFRR